MENHPKPLLKHTHIVKLARFLDMMYRPSEIAEELGVHKETVYRSYLPAGLPYIEDDKHRFWIHGPAFVAWAKETVAKKRTDRKGLEEGYAWCMKCNTPVKMAKPTIKPVNRYIELLQAKCPHCHRIVNRAQARRGA